MRFNLFHRGKHRQSPAEVRAERDALAAECADLQARLEAADELIATLVVERDWFHDHWEEEGHRAAEAEIVAKCLDEQLVEARRVRADLEAIAGPHVSSADTATPLFAEVTQEIRLPAAAEPDPDQTLPVAVMTLAAAVGAR